MEREEEMLAAQRGECVRGANAKIGTRARGMMHYQQKVHIATRGEAAQRAKDKVQIQNMAVPFLLNEFREYVKVKDLATTLTTEGVELVMALMAARQNPTAEQMAFIMKSQDEYRRAHFDELYMKERNLQYAKRDCSAAIMYAGEYMDSLLIELLSSFDKVKQLNRCHPSIPIRKRIKKFSRETYGHSVQRSFAKAKNEEACYDAMDRFIEKCIDPVWKPMCEYMAACHKAWWADKEHDEQRKAIEKLGVTPELALQVEQACEFGRVLLAVYKTCENELIKCGYPEDYKIPLTADSMLNGVEMLRCLARLLFGNGMVTYDRDPLVEKEVDIVKAICNTENIIRAADTGQIAEMARQKKEWTEWAAQHPSWDDALLYRSYRLAHPKDSMEEILAKEIGDAHNKTWEAELKKPDHKPFTKKEYKEVWKRICVTADEMLTPSIKDQEYMTQRQRADIEKAHPDWTEEQVILELANQEFTGIPLHTTASYEVLHRLIALRLPQEFQDVLKDIEEKRKVANERRKAKRQKVKSEK